MSPNISNLLNVHRLIAVRFQSALLRLCPKVPNQKEEAQAHLQGGVMASSLIFWGTDLAISIPKSCSAWTNSSSPCSGIVFSQSLKKPPSDAAGEHGGEGDDDMAGSNHYRLPYFEPLGWKHVTPSSLDFLLSEPDEVKEWGTLKTLFTFKTSKVSSSWMMLNVLHHFFNIFLGPCPRFQTKNRWRYWSHRGVSQRPLSRPPRRSPEHGDDSFLEPRVSFEISVR